MRIIRHSFEKEIVCPRCNAILYYVAQDIHSIGDMEGNYIDCVKCPECNKQIKVL